MKAMRHFLISCELRTPNYDYQPLHDKLAALGALPQESDTNPLWAADLDMEVMQVVDALSPYVHPDTDKVVALEVDITTGIWPLRPKRRTASAYLRDLLVKVLGKVLDWTTP
jgi:hypothetical protein